MAADTVMIMKGLAEAEKVIRDHVPERYIGYARQACVDAIEYMKNEQDIINKAASFRTFVLLPYVSNKGNTLNYRLKMIVRCSECKHQKSCIKSLTNDDPKTGFCAWGEGEYDG